MVFSKGQFEPTVVHRAQFKSRPSIISGISDKGVLELTPEGSPPSTSGGSSGNNSGKSSVPRPAVSTGKTSLESKSSSKSNVVSASQHSSENKKIASQRAAIEAGSSENVLSSIAEVEKPAIPAPLPTIVTVENAAAAKVFFECHYNDASSGASTLRSLRRRQLEAALYEDVSSTPFEKDERRRALMKRENEHLRRTRVMKARGLKALKGKDVTSKRYEVVKVLGKGSFGVVRLVREKADDGPSGSVNKKKDIYAMKVIRKSDMLRNSQEGHLRAERDFLVAAEGSRWVVPLIASFQDLNNLYLVMDYMPGGDFLGLLIRDNVLSEHVTKWYIAEMILCIEEAHALRWIHRDIKPDNFLISASGHLKISDFGLAFDGHWSHDQAYYNHQRYSLLTKLGISVEGDSIDKKEGRTVAAAMKVANVMMAGKERHEKNMSNGSGSEGILNWRNRFGNRSLARSVVGTSQYMAPEVVRGELYDARCDWWSVAVILYECLYGHTPFLAEEGGRQQTKMNILNHKQTFAFPHKPPVSKRCQDLIRSIIQEKDGRLCSKRYRVNDQASQSSGSRQNRDHAGRYVYPHDAEDIKAHKWFRDIQWDHIHRMVPPFVPQIRSMDDTQYFDEEEPISDFSDSASGPEPTKEEIAEALRPFTREIQILAKGFIERPHDSSKLRKVEKEIDTFVIPEEQKEYLKSFVKHYGKKERKRPRDKLLRDRETAPKVLELRKRGAFLGYTYRRFQTGRDSIGRGTGRGVPVTHAGSTSKKVWYRSRLSIH
ncbi:kinase-like domain-containing protein [Tricladium varicosporioides]|nr:kinase-like domain-containing protein [Hymenoscyphus varicosporioides]